ncbi:hypothetical protein ACVWZZ_006361 [Bradyrhizobium sp. LM6.10]
MIDRALLATPADSAISSIVVAANPCAPNKRRAAVRIASEVAARRSACFAMSLV